MKKIPSAVEQINVQLFYNPIIQHVSVNTFERKGSSLTKGKSFIVPDQEGTNVSILNYDYDLNDYIPVLMRVSDITDTHVITETHGAFSKEICWSKS